jgi:hypothetical protein
VNQVLGNLVHLHHPDVMTLTVNGRRELTTTWEHYRFAIDGNYGTTQGAVTHDFWGSIFSMHSFFFITLVYQCISCCIFCFAVMFPVAQGGQPPGACTLGLQPHCSQGCEGEYS